MTVASAVAFVTERSKVGVTGAFVSGGGCVMAVPFVSDDAFSAAFPLEVSPAAGSRWQPWISIPINSSTFATTMVHTTNLNRSRRCRRCSACGEPGALNGFSAFTDFWLQFLSSTGATKAANIVTD
jgi:hypothetical protein